MGLDKNAGRTHGTQAAGVQGVIVDDRNAHPYYTNFCRVNATPEEVILDFGLNSEPSNAGHAIPISHRIVCNFYTAKRLLMVLGAAIERHEETFGELEIDVAKRVKAK
jgi:hypothetical protein